LPGNDLGHLADQSWTSVPERMKYAG